MNPKVRHSQVGGGIVRLNAVGVIVVKRIIAPAARRVIGISVADALGVPCDLKAADVNILSPGQIEGRAYPMPSEDLGLRSITGAVGIILTENAGMLSGRACRNCWVSAS